MFHQLDLVLPAEPYDGPMQMALDEVLLRSVVRPMLRIYRWSAPCVTFGYFQKLEEARRVHPAMPMVRRWTGGGMVEHGNDLTFSLIIPAGEKIASEAPASFYRQLHGRLAGWIRSRLPVSVDLAGGEEVRLGTSCFQAPANDDLLIRGRKVLGGALRRSKGGLLYQGSLRVSEIPGWNPLRISPRSWAEAFMDCLETRTMDASILREAGELVGTRYGTTGWNHRK